VKFERAPTLFGPMSVRTESRLSQGRVLVEVDAPPRPAAKWILHVPLPTGWRIVSATIRRQAGGDGPDGVVDLTGKAGSIKCGSFCGESENATELSRATEADRPTD